MKMKQSAQQIALDLFQNCDFPEELSEPFDAEVVLNDNAIGRSRYALIVFAVIMREKSEVVQHVLVSPAECL